MAAVVARLTGALFVVALTMIALALLGGRGEDSQQALGAYGRYLPGNTVPAGVECRSMYEYYHASGEMCTLEAAPYCQRGYLIVRGAMITYLRLIACNFPAVYLIAEYGRPQRITRYRRVTLLLWDGMSAQLRNTGWFNSMQPVSTVGWW
jgi:hypothetical protein